MTFLNIQKHLIKDTKQKFLQTTTPFQVNKKRQASTEMYLVFHSCLESSLTLSPCGCLYFKMPSRQFSRNFKLIEEANKQIANKQKRVNIISFRNVNILLSILGQTSFILQELKGFDAIDL